VELTVANTILQQLGGGRALMMLGAGQPVGDATSVMFAIKGSPLKVNKIRITLDPSDTYTVEFLRYSRKTLEVTVTNYWDGVYAEDLRRVIESHTGLYLSL
jgi:hypothetical protein